MARRPAEKSSLKFIFHSDTDSKTLHRKSEAHIHMYTMNPTTARPRKMGESERHRYLKALSLSWAREQKFDIAAIEVSFPHRRFRFDLAAFKPRYRVPEKVDFTGELGLTAVFECKQSRPDLIRDCKMKAATLARLHGLCARKAKLEELLKVHLPHLSRGEELFPEFDSYRLEESGHKTYSRVVTAIRESQNALAYKTKFDRLLGYRIANLHYIVTEPGIAEPHEIPVGWGHLVHTGGSLALQQAPVMQATGSKAQHVFLQRIALAGTCASQRFPESMAPGTPPPFPFPGKENS